MNQRYLMVLLQVSNIVISGLLCIDNDITFIISRVLVGYMSGLLRPTGQTLLYQLTPPGLRQTALTCYSMFLPTGIIVVLIWGYLDDAGTLLWRVALMFQVIPSLAIITLAFTYFRDVDSPINLLRMKKTQDLEELL